MTDYTPTYEEVAFDYASSYGIERHRERVAAFDRWLAAHDAKVYQRGREDASNAALAAFMDCYGEVDATRMQIVAAALLDMPSAARGDGLTGNASSSDLDADEIRIKDGEQA